jgi:lysophospholipase L1-like esterase
MAQPVFTTTPSISGNPWVGQTLTRTDAASAGNTITGQWFLGSAPIAGQTASTLVLTAAHVGKAVSYQTIATSADPLVSTILSAETKGIIAQPVLGSRALSTGLTSGLACAGFISGNTPGSTITSNLSGLTVSGLTYAWDGTGAPGATANALVETLANTSGSPKSTSITVSACYLGRLVLSGNLVFGVASTGTITGATTGSTITSNTPGLTVNSGARTYTWDGTGEPNRYFTGLTETLAAAVVSPKYNQTAIILAPGLPGGTPVIPLNARFAIFGDSLTDQAGSVATKGINNSLARMMFKLNGALRATPGSGLGNAGATLQQLQTRVSYLAKQRPDVLFMDGGVNVSGTFADAFTAAQAIWTAVWAENPNCIIFMDKIKPQTVSAADATYCAGFNALLDGAASSKLHIVPVPVGWNPATHTREGLHYNPPGGKLVAENLMAQFTVATGTVYDTLSDPNYGPNLDTETALTGTGGTMTGAGTTPTGSVATGKNVDNATSATVVCSKGAYKGYESQVITISGTVSAQGVIKFSEAAASSIAATFAVGENYEHFAYVKFTAADGVSAPVGINNLYENVGGASSLDRGLHFNTTQESTTTTLPDAFEGVLRAWPGEFRVATAGINPEISVLPAVGTVDIRIEIAAPVVRKTELLAYAPPAYASEYKMVSANEKLQLSGTLTNGSTITINPGSWTGGGKTFGAKRIYQGASTDTANGTGTLLATVAAGTTWTWTAAGLTTGQYLFVEVDCANSFGTVTERSRTGLLLP